MRIVQIIGLFAGIIAFGLAGLFAGREAGDTWWRAGVAILLTDIVLILLGGRQQEKL
jgi:hypothetical protein